MVELKCTEKMGGERIIELDIGAEYGIKIIDGININLWFLGINGRVYGWV